MYLKLMVSIVLLLITLAVPAFAADLAAGVQAYRAGDYGKALEVFKQLAEKGDAEAQNYLGDMYERGEGVSIDFEEAAVWHRKAAEGGNIRAQYMISIKYAIGMGVPQDSALADKWLRRAADGGLPDAQNTLGLAYYEGKTVPKDMVQALAWILKAEAQGLADAKHNHGVFVRDMTPEQIAAAHKQAGIAPPTTPSNVDP